MADVFTPEFRSYNMSLIRSKNTKPELVVRKFLHSNGFRFRLYDKNLPGKPDIILKKYKTVIFVHGCFWHNHKNCKYSNAPKSNIKYWKSKLENNVKRDKLIRKKIKKFGWRIIVIWECKLRIKENDQTLNKLIDQINNLV